MAMSPAGASAMSPAAVVKVGMVWWAWGMRRWLELRDCVFWLCCKSLCSG